MMVEHQCSFFLAITDPGTDCLRQLLIDNHHGNKFVEHTAQLLRLLAVPAQEDWSRVTVLRLKLANHPGQLSGPGPESLGCDKVAERVSTSPAMKSPKQKCFASLIEMIDRVFVCLDVAQGIPITVLFSALFFCSSKSRDILVAKVVVKVILQLVPCNFAGSSTLKKVILCLLVANYAVLHDG